MSRRSTFLWLTVLCLSSALLAPAQTFYGSVLGSVTDRSGGAIASAPVTLTNTGTAERRTASTDANGNYQFLNLVPGTYKVDIEQAGFKHLTRDQIDVQVEAAVRVNASLEVGDVTQTVEVSSQAALLQTESATLNQVVEGRRVLDMPLNGRNVLNLIGLVPGVVPQGSTQGSPLGNQSGGSSTNTAGFGNYQIGGGITGQNATFIDGAPDNSPGNNAVILIPTQDAIQEFSVATNNISAEFWGFGGGVVNMTTKSGTNSYHGSVYEYLRNKVLNANDFFNNRAGVPVPPFTQNQYGGSVGGPVRHNKTFFFASWEGFNLRKGIATTYTMPTANFLKGNFAGQNTIYDPLTTCGTGTNGTCALNAAGQPVISRTPFPSNQIPASRFDPTTLVMQKYWVPPNAPGTVNNYKLNVPAGGNANQITGRGDHSFNDKQRLFGRYTWWGIGSVPSDPFGNLTGSNQIFDRVHQAVVGYSYTISPTLILDVRGSLSFQDYPTDSPAIGVDMAQFGPGWASIAKQMSFTTYPGETITGGFRAQSGLGQVSKNNDTSAVASLTKVKGLHTIKFGGMFKRDWSTSQNNSPAGGTFNFDATFTSLNATNSTTSGLGFASFILGYPTNGQLATVNITHPYLNAYGGYVTDTWQVRPSLTLTLGLRWDQPGAYGESNNNNTVLGLATPDPLGAKVGLPNLVGQPILVASPGYSRNLDSQLHWNDFGPRAGVAWRAMKDTVIRSGFGVSYLPYNLGGGSVGQAAVNKGVTTMVTTLDGGLTPYATMSNPFPSGLVSPAGRTPGFLQTLEGGGIIGSFPDLQPAKYVEQWNLTIQRDLGHDMMVQATYAGSAGRHLAFTVPNAGNQLDQLPDQYLSLGTGLLTQVPNPFYGVLPPGVGVLGQKTVAEGYLLKPYPQFQSIQATVLNQGVSSYNALQMTFQKRFRAGGTIVANYTWSKLLSDTDSTTGFVESGVTPGWVQDWNNLRAGYSLVSEDVPRRLVISYVYDLPFGKGRQFLSNLKGVANQLLGGWSVNGVTTIADGFPLAMTSLANTLSQQFNASVQVSPYSSFMRPNVVSGCDGAISGSAQSRLNEWFNTACFTQPGALAFGNASRTDPRLQQPGIANWDVSLNKSVTVREGWNLEFHTEFFNVANRVQFAAPNMQVGNPNFGVITATSLASNPRLIQFALRLKF